MAATTLATYDLDNMVTTAIDTMSTDPVNMLTDSGEKFLKTAAQRGRMFVVNDAENVRHTLIYNGRNATVNYVPDNVTGVALSAVATEVVTQSLWALNASSRNINFPQSQPSGNVMDYVATVVKANMMEILNQEEALFVRGVADPTGTEALNAPHPGDDDYNTALPMSLPSLVWSSSGSHGTATSEEFAGIKVSEVAKWAAHQGNGTVTGSSPNQIASDLMGDFQKAALNASYSDVERPTHIYTSLVMFEKFLAELRADAALPDPVHANLGLEGTATFAGMTVDWSRYLNWDVVWDPAASSFVAEHPVLGINWNSLRLNVVRAGGIESDKVGFIRQIGGLQPHPALTNLFKRLEWKRCWSLDNGRRSFFKISDYTDEDQK